MKKFKSRIDVEYDVNDIEREIRDDHENSTVNNSMVMNMTKRELERAKVIFPNLENERSELLKLMLLEIRGMDWSTLGNSMILKHDYIQSILIKRERG